MINYVQCIFNVIANQVIRTRKLIKKLVKQVKKNSQQKAVKNYNNIIFNLKNVVVYLHYIYFYTLTPCCNFTRLIPNMCQNCIKTKKSTQ